MLNAAMQRICDGGLVIIKDDDARENEGDLAFSAALATTELVNFAITHGRGLLCVAMKGEDADRIGIARIPPTRPDIHGTPFAYPISLRGPGTGISASARSNTVRAVADRSTRAADFCVPGHVQTLIACGGGLADRRGHTEAVVTLMELCRLPPFGVITELLGASGDPASTNEVSEFGRRYDIPIVQIEDIVREVAQRHRGG